MPAARGWAEAKEEAAAAAGVRRDGELLRELREWAQGAEKGQRALEERLQQAERATLAGFRILSERVNGSGAGGFREKRRERQPGGVEV
jgi:hypothetical protein